MRYTLTLLLLILILAPIKAQEFYELKKFISSGVDQEKRLDDYLKNAYIPAAKKAGVSAIGVFKPVNSDQENKGKLVFVLTPFKDLNKFEKFTAALDKDQTYQSRGKDYIDAPYDNPPYARIETTLLRAFSGFKKLRKPPFTNSPSDRVYELRSYEGATEKIYRNKVEMFNEGGEIEIFEKLGFNAVFYGEVFIGKEQPNLIYMTTFENMKSRDQHWDTFRSDPDWEKLRDNPRYQNNVSGRWTYLLSPTDYSDL